MSFALRGSSFEHLMGGCYLLSHLLQLIVFTSYFHIHTVQKSLLLLSR